MYIHKLSTPIEKNELQVNAEENEHVCYFIRDVVLNYGIMLHV